MKRLLFLFSLAGLVCQLSNAQVTLDECRQMARQNNPSIRMHGIISATKDYSISNASMQWVPSIQIGALGGMLNNPMKISDLYSNSNLSTTTQNNIDQFLYEQMNVMDLPNYSYKVSASLSQNIYDGGVSRTAKKIAQAQADVQIAETDVTLGQVCDRVDEIYFSILLLEKRILQTDSKTEVLNAAKNRTVALQNAGALRCDETDQIDAACIETQQQRICLESSLKSFRAALSLLVGKDLMTEELITPSPTVQPRAVPQTLLLDRRMSLLELEKEKLNIALRPRLNLVADVYYGYPNRNVFGNFVSRNPKINAFVGLGMSWNLDALYTRKNDLAIISQSLEKLNIQKEILNLDTRISNNDANNQVERLNKCIEQDNKLVSIRERLRKSAELSYSQGEITADMLLSRIDDEYQAVLNSQIHQIECLRELYKMKEE